MHRRVNKRDRSDLGPTVERGTRPDVIVYLDSSVLARAYLSDKTRHDAAVAMLEDPELGLITGTWTRIEVSGALVRAARAGRGDQQGLLALLDADLAVDGSVTVVASAQEEVETQALRLVRAHAIRAVDAWHLATAKLVVRICSLVAGT